MAIADSTVKQRVQFQDVEAYNVFNDPQLADVYDDMGYFMHSGSPQETSWLLARKKQKMNMQLTRRVTLLVEY